MAIIPTVIHENRAYDLFSRMLEDRVIFLTSEVNDQVAELIVSQLLFLEASDPNKDITFYINSPGGSITAGMAIFDTMNFVRCDIQTICIGQACSMGSFLLAAGTQGKRFALPNSHIMIHQPLGGFYGQATDAEIRVKLILRMKETLYRNLAKFTGQKYEKIYADCERDHWLSSEEAAAYKLVDHVIENREQAAKIAEHISKEAEKKAKQNEKASKVKSKNTNKSAKPSTTKPKKTK